MNLNLVMRYSYLAAWVCGVIAVLYRVLEGAGIHAVNAIPASPRGVMMLAGFLFLASIASAAMAQAQGSTSVKGRVTGA